MQRFFGVQLDLVPALVTVCGLLYLIALALEPRAALQIRGLDFLSPSTRALYVVGQTGRGAFLSGAWWTIFTAVYLHGSLLHIVFNMWWLRSLGAEAQESFGRARFFVLFAASGAGGFLLTCLLGRYPSVGASGSIFGLLGALLVYGRRRGGSWGEALSRQMLQWAVILFIFGLMMERVDNWAHLGGFVTGVLIARRMPGAEQRAEGRGMQALAIGLAVVTVVGFLLSVVRFLPLLRG